MIELSHPSVALFRQRVLALAPESLNTSWEDALIPHGAALAGRAWGDDALTAWATRWCDYHLAAGIREVPDQGNAHPPAPAGFFINDYCGHWGGPLPLSALCFGNNESRYRDAILEICSAAPRRAVRLNDGVIAHGGGRYARHSVWVDTLYYTASVFAEAFHLTTDPAYASEAVRQCVLHAQLLQDATTGCFFHDAHLASGVRSQWFWSRGNGWAIMAFADTLRRCPPDTPGWSDVLQSYRALVTGLLRLQHPSGLWRIIPENSASHLETSGSAMILIGLTLGIEAGWIERSVAHHVQLGFRELLTWIHPQTGAFLGAQRPAGLGGWEAHKLSTLGECTYATGIFLRLLAELKRTDLLAPPIAEITDEQRYASAQRLALVTPRN